MWPKIGGAFAMIHNVQSNVNLILLSQQFDQKLEICIRLFNLFEFRLMWLHTGYGFSYSEATNCSGMYDLFGHW